ncbi:hypothetical protein [Holospora undulata]|uniref:Uncharacterized protein n=1 Tax=Holospora undulata HU1 TaxID=1321371 RepID=A0A061JJ07_9PROT|nr:hypothetical protein [Holospora undulata]ETZ05484.1 hypothetical protein K737_300075 [Holospora undulata HU1]
MKKIFIFLLSVVEGAYLSLAFSNNEEEKSLKNFSESLQEFTSGKSLVNSVKPVDFKFFLDKVKDTADKEISFLEGVLCSENFQCVNEQSFMDPFFIMPEIENRCARLGEKINVLKSKTFCSKIKSHYESVLEKHEEFKKLVHERNQVYFRSELSSLLDQKKEDRKLSSRLSWIYSKYLRKHSDSLNGIMVVSMPFLNKMSYQFSEFFGYSSAFSKYSVVHGYEKTMTEANLLIKDLSPDDLPVLFNFIQNLANEQNGVKFVSPNRFVQLRNDFQENFREVRRKLCFGTKWLMPIATHIFQYIKNLNKKESSSGVIEQFQESNNEDIFSKKNGIVVNFNPLFFGANLIPSHSISFVEEENGHIALIDATRSLLKEDIVFPLNSALIAENLEKAIKRQYFFVPLCVPSWEFSCEVLK